MNEGTEALPPNSPEKAFNDLGAQIIVLRRAVEDWHETLKAAPPPDHSEDFKALETHADNIYTLLNDTGRQLDRLEKMVMAIQAIPTNALEALKHEGSELLGESEKRFRVAESHLGAAERNLRNLFDQVVTQREQRWAVIRAGLIGSVVGFFLGVIVMWPSTEDGGLSQWDAGLVHLQQADPIAWNQLTADSNLVRANRAKIEACQAAATKSKKEQNCTITVAVPEPPTEASPPTVQLPMSDADKSKQTESAPRH